jgi:hypothetical protein
MEVKRDQRPSMIPEKNNNIKRDQRPSMQSQNEEVLMLFVSLNYYHKYGSKEGSETFHDSRKKIII